MLHLKTLVMGTKSIQNKVCQIRIAACIIQTTGLCSLLRLTLYLLSIVLQVQRSKGLRTEALDWRVDGSFFFRIEWMVARKCVVWNHLVEHLPHQENVWKILSQGDRPTAIPICREQLQTVCDSLGI